MPGFLKSEGSSTLIFLRLTPKGGKDAIEGPLALADERVVLKARVRAAPENGEANAALLKLISKALGLPVSSLSLASGQMARIKTIRVERNLDEVAKAFASDLSIKD